MSCSSWRQRNILPLMQQQDIEHEDEKINVVAATLYIERSQIATLASELQYLHTYLKNTLISSNVVDFFDFALKKNAIQTLAQNPNITLGELLNRKCSEVYSHASFDSSLFLFIFSIVVN